MEVNFGLVFVLNFKNVIKKDFDVFSVKTLAEVFGVLITYKIWFHLALVTASISAEEISIITFFIMISSDTVSTFG